MAINFDDLVSELEVHAMHGIELPTDPHTDEVHTSTLKRWANDAAQAINRQRRRTTVAETTITIVEGQNTYELPEDVRDVTEIIREGTGDILNDHPDLNRHSPPVHVYGRLPTGQSTQGSLDLIHRQHLTRREKKNRYDLIGSKIRFLFTLEPGEEICVRYTTIDRSLENLPEDRFELVLTYMMYKNLDWFIGKNGSNIVADANGLHDEGWSAIFRRRAELQEQWHSSLNAIGHELDTDTGST